MKKRIFISAPVSDSVKNKIVRLQKKFVSFEGVRWESGNKLHITLYFLRYLDDSEIQQVKTVLSEIKFKNFKAILAGYNFFPSKKQPRVIVLQIQSNDAIEKLQKEIGAKLNKYKFFKSEKRKFKAHLTFGRVKNITDKEIKLVEKEKIEGSWQINEVDLMRSILMGKRGSKYEMLKKFKN